jgi:hypothetical protein
VLLNLDLFISKRVDMELISIYSTKYMLQVDDIIQFLGHDPLMTVQDVVNWTTRSQSTVYEWIAKKGLQVEESNGVSRIRLSELTRFVGALDKGTFQPPPSVAKPVRKCICKCATCSKCEGC